MESIETVSEKNASLVTFSTIPLKTFTPGSITDDNAQLPTNTLVLIRPF